MTNSITTISDSNVVTPIVEKQQKESLPLATLVKAIVLFILSSAFFILGIVGMPLLASLLPASAVAAILLPISLVMGCMGFVTGLMGLHITYPKSPQKAPTPIVIIANNENK